MIPLDLTRRESLWQLIEREYWRLDASTAHTENEDAYDRLLKKVFTKKPRKRAKRRILGTRRCQSCQMAFAYDDARVRYCKACRRKRAAHADNEPAEAASQPPPLASGG